RRRATLWRGVSRMADQWFYVVDNANKGPVDRDALIRRARDGRIQRATLVWKDGMKDWAEAGTLDFLYPKDVAPPPPLPPPPVAAPVPQPVAAPVAAQQRDLRGMLGGIGN